MIVDAFRFGRIGRDGVIVIAVLDDPTRRLFVRFLVDVVFCEDIHRLTVAVVVAADEAVRIRIPAPVLALEDAVKMRNFFVRDFPQFQIVKDAAAVTVGHALVFMFVRGRVDFLQVFCVGNKLRAQPFRRGFRVAGMMEYAPRVRGNPLLVYPAGFAFRRVIRRKIVGIRTATQHGLVNRTFFFRPAKLVFFLLPQDADIAERRLDGFQFQRVVTATKIDRLAGFFQHDFQRRQLAVKFIVQPQFVDRPFHLGIHAVFQGVTHLADDTGMHRRVVFQQLDDFQGYIRRFQAAAAALEDVRHVRLNAPVDVDKRPA